MPAPHLSSAYVVIFSKLRPALWFDAVISVVEARVVRLLCGHKREVLELAAVPAAPRLLLSLSRDGNLRLWDVPSETCLSSIHTDATCIVSGGLLLVGKCHLLLPGTEG